MAHTDFDIYQKALQADKEGDWEGAHDLVQDLPDAKAAWIHAYLHRKEGDRWNANYWYTRAGKPFFEGSFDAEWQQLWDELSA